MELAHPFQRSGAWAIALQHGREHPGLITDADLDRQVETIAADCERAGRLVKGQPGWAWLVRLAAMYPQSPPVHPSRHKNARPIGQRVAAFLQPDPGPGPGERSWPCWSCGADGVTVRWGKDRWPLTAPVQQINTTAAYGGGLPSCRACRIAVWSLPYATGQAGRLNQTVISYTDLAAEQAVTAAHYGINRQALDDGWTTWQQGPGTDDVLWQTLAELPDPALGGPGRHLEIIRWRADNREPEMAPARQLSPHACDLLATAWRRGDADDLRRAARCAAGTHPVDLAADRNLLEQALLRADRTDAAVLAAFTPPAHETPTTAPTSAPQPAA